MLIRQSARARRCNNKKNIHNIHRALLSCSLLNDFQSFSNDFAGEVRKNARELIKQGNMRLQLTQVQCIVSMSPP